MLSSGSSDKGNIPSVLYLPGSYQQLWRKAFGEECLSRSCCHQRFKRFKDSRTSTVDDARSGRPSTSINDDNVAKVNTLV
ncbi:hypothetical protein J6590_075908 [Homalodisca vitripennis]|nr:hypothetical protein J6590_075908 [Homalodisca vitripennis]